MNTANWMIQAIEQRRQTMLKVMNFIVDRQRDFFEKGVRVPQAAHAARGGRSHQHARVDGQPGDQREVRPDAARRAAAQVLLLVSALATASGEDVSARGIKAPELQKLVSDEDSAKTAHRPGDRAPFSGAGDPDRAPHGREVPRPARDPLGAHAQAGMTLPAAETLDVSVLVPAKDEAENLPMFCVSARRRWARPDSPSKWSSSTTARATRARGCSASSGEATRSFASSPTGGSAASPTRSARG